MLMPVIHLKNLLRAKYCQLYVFYERCLTKVVVVVLVVLEIVVVGLLIFPTWVGITHLSALVMLHVDDTM